MTTVELGGQPELGRWYSIELESSPGDGISARVVEIDTGRLITEVQPVPADAAPARFPPRDVVPLCDAPCLPAEEPMITNDETTGRESTCAACGERIEEALLLKGLMVRVSPDPLVPREPSPGVPRWRRLDRGHGSARCPKTADGAHMPTAEERRP